MSLMNCPECGHEVSDKAEICTNCGYKIAGKEEEKKYEQEDNELTVTKENDDGWKMGSHATQVQEQTNPKKKHGCFTTIMFVLLACFLLSKCGGGAADDSETAKEPTSQVAEQAQMENISDETNIIEDEASSNKWEEKYKEKDIKYVDLKFLHKNSKYYKDNVVLCYGKVQSVGKREIKFDTNKNNFFIEITCIFEEDVNEIKEGQNICFVGLVGDTTSLLGNDTVKIENCYIIAREGDASKYLKKIKKNKNMQKKYIYNMKSKQKKEEEDEVKKEKKNYINKCKSYRYKSIQRNPDKYKGKEIKVSGKVIQIAEGLFDSVTLRVEDSSGNIWYINYSYAKKEKKILENDKLNIYGECTGTKTYTTVLGSSVTIPSVEAKYIE